MTFGERVKQVRLALNLSQEEMAKELGVSFATINRWENSHNNPTYEALQRFEQFCVEKNLKKNIIQAYVCLYYMLKYKRENRI